MHDRGSGLRHNDSPDVKFSSVGGASVDAYLWLGLLIILCFCVSCLLCLCGHLFICALWSPAGKGLTFWLSFLVSNCEFVTFRLVSWVRCGT